MRRRKRQNAQVRLVIDYSFYNFVRMQIRQSDLRLRISRGELLAIDAHVVQPHRINHGHAHRPAHQRSRRCDFRFRLFEVIQKDEASLKKLLSFRRHHEGSLRSIDQLGAELFLELADRLARCRLRNTMGGSSQREAAGPDNVAIKTERVEIHSFAYNAKCNR